MTAALGGRYTASADPVGAAYDSRDADGAARHREVRCVALAGESLSGATRGVACSLASNDVRLHVAAVGPGIGTARKVARRYDASVLALLDDWSIGR